MRHVLVVVCIGAMGCFVLVGNSAKGKEAQHGQNEHLVAIGGHGEHRGHTLSPYLS
ncbi:MAG: hypothetical protein H6815_11775 [Phycisphaeraceae bacterium]|nr:hypothetical protein [Phycisphaerales bacterium]MCB9861118.1 hypothetical protein [Phycisphaeraceae bacterium]